MDVVMKLSLVLMFAPTSVAYEAYETYQGPDNKEHHCWYCCENSTNLKFCWDRCENYCDWCRGYQQCTEPPTVTNSPPAVPTIANGTAHVIPDQSSTGMSNTDSSIFFTILCTVTVFACILISVALLIILCLICKGSKSSSRLYRWFGHVNVKSDTFEEPRNGQQMQELRTRRQSSSIHVMENGDNGGEMGTNNRGPHRPLLSSNRCSISEHSVGDSDTVTESETNFGAEMQNGIRINEGENGSADQTEPQCSSEMCGDQDAASSILAEESQGSANDFQDLEPLARRQLGILEVCHSDNNMTTLSGEAELEELRRDSVLEPQVENRELNRGTNNSTGRKPSENHEFDIDMYSSEYTQKVPQTELTPISGPEGDSDVEVSLLERSFALHSQGWCMDQDDSTSSEQASASGSVPGYPPGYREIQLRKPESLTSDWQVGKSVTRDAKKDARRPARNPSEGLFAQEKQNHMPSDKRQSFPPEIVNSEDTPGTLGNQRVQAVGPADLPQPASALSFHQQESGQEQEVVTRDEEVKKREELIPGFIHPSKQRNRRIYDQLKKIDWVMGYYSAGDSIEVYVNLGSLDPHVVEQQLADITGADITKFHVKQNEEPEFDYSL